MVDAVPATMDLASASGEDLAEVSDIVTDSMTAFNMKAKEASHFTERIGCGCNQFKHKCW